jgi:hypothetical protein
MDRKIFFVLAAIAGICAAILLLPSRDDTVLDDVTPPDRNDAEDAHQDDQPAEQQASERKPHRDPQFKAQAQAANEARQASPFYQHTQDSAKRWQVLANTIGPQGHEELAAEMRDVANQVRTANRPDGTEEAKQTALEAETAMLEKLAGLDLELNAEMTEIIEFLQQARQSYGASADEQAAE